MGGTLSQKLEGGILPKTGGLGLAQTCEQAMRMERRRAESKVLFQMNRCLFKNTSNLALPSYSSPKSNLKNANVLSEVVIVITLCEVNWNMMHACI